MLASGSSALISYKMGQNKQREARENFTFMFLFCLFSGCAFVGAILAFKEQIIHLLGANDVILPFCKEYLSVYVFFLPLNMIQLYFQYLFVAASRQTLGFLLSLAGGIMNVLLDYLFISPLGMGIAGAALASGISLSLPAIVGIFYFSFSQHSSLRFCKCKPDLKLLFRIMTNGSSEMITQIASSVVTLLFNLIAMRFYGENGVAAITIVLYAQFLLTALYMGYTSGVSPVISFKFGKEDSPQLKMLISISFRFIFVCSAIIFFCALITARPIANFFSPPGSDVNTLAIKGFYLYSISYLLAGINIFISGLFTALLNGKLSFLLSLLRSFLCVILGFALLIFLFGKIGMWLAVPFAELLSFLISFAVFFKYKGNYNY